MSVIEKAALGIASNLVDRTSILENSTLVYGNSATLFVDYTSITDQGIVSTFTGFRTRVKYAGESIKAIKASFNIEKSGYEVICKVWSDTLELLASKTMVCNSSGRQWKMFQFDTILDDSIILDDNFYVSIQTVLSTGCKLHPGYVEASANMTGSAGNPNYYVTDGNTEWASVGSGSFAGALEFISESQITIGYPDGMFTQAITNWTQDITLPPTLYLVVGKEYNVYFENIVSDDVNKYYFDVGCDIGVQQNERWTCTPATPGDYGFYLTVYDKMMNLIKSVSCTLKVCAVTTNNGVTKTCIFMGDSLTAAGTYTGELITLCGVGDVMNLTLQGVQGSGGNLHEGVSGWTVADHYGSSSNFYFSGAFNFTSYMTARGYTLCDWFFIFLGINDIFSYSTDTGVDAVCVANKTKLDAMITSIKAWNSTVKVCLMLPCTGSNSQDAFGKSYNSNQNQMQFKRNIHRYTKYLIDNYKDKTADRIYLLASNANLDTKNNMAVETVALNSRNSTTTVRQANGVHPADTGYYQIADTVYYFLKNDYVS
jgi:lysophospholipase L1-like esterase